MAWITWDNLPFDCKSHEKAVLAPRNSTDLTNPTYYTAQDLKMKPFHENLWHNSQTDTTHKSLSESRDQFPFSSWDFIVSLYFRWLPLKHWGVVLSTKRNSRVFRGQGTNSKVNISWQNVLRLAAPILKSVAWNRISNHFQYINVPNTPQHSFWGFGKVMGKEIDRFILVLVCFSPAERSSSVSPKDPWIHILSQRAHRGWQLGQRKLASDGPFWQSLP